MRLLVTAVTGRTFHTGLRDICNIRKTIRVAHFTVVSRQHIAYSSVVGCAPRRAPLQQRRSAPLRPLCCRSMTVQASEQDPRLDRDKFRSTLRLKALRVPKAQCHKFMQAFAQ